MNWKLPLTVALLALFGWVGWEIARAGTDVTIVRVPGADTLKHGKIQGKRIDGRSWSMDYDTATFSADGTQATIAHVRDGRIHRAGKPDVLMTADGVTVNTLSNDLVVTGPVVFREKQPSGATRTFTTTGARYVGATRILNLDRPVTVTEGDAKVVLNKVSIDFRTGAVNLGPLEGVKPGTE